MTDADGGQPSPETEWGLVSGVRVWSGGHHDAAKRVLLARLTGATRPRHGMIDLGFLAPASVDEAIYFAGKILPRLKPPATIWIIHPVAGSGHSAGFDGTFEALCEALAELGLFLGKTVQVHEGFRSAMFQAGEG
jgi:hypothetical protein